MGMRIGENRAKSVGSAGELAAMRRLVASQAQTMATLNSVGRGPRQYVYRDITSKGNTHSSSSSRLWLAPIQQSRIRTHYMSLRAFISSTMEDLGNERRAVAKQLRSMGIEPLHAEEIAPSGRASWEAIAEKIESSHLFILILGDRYGWVPTSGYGAGKGDSVTHLELQHARDQNKLVLVFIKKLPYGAKKDKKRDAFRREVSDWDGGVFRQDFEWADELSLKVEKAVTELYTDALLKEIIRRTDDALAPGAGQHSSPVFLSYGFDGAISKDVLIAGAGMSISAGFPTASLLIRILAKDLWPEEGDSLQQSFAFSEVAEYYEKRFGRTRLVERLKEAMSPPQVTQPTKAHLLAVQYFRAIITTNYDTLFEDACRSAGVPFVVLTPDLKSSPQSAGCLSIYKLAGSISDATTLCLTATELEKSAATWLLDSAQKIIDRHPVVVVGHGMRDGLIPQLLMRRERKNSATWVVPRLQPMDQILMTKYDIDVVEAFANDYMERLANSIVQS